MGYGSVAYLRYSDEQENYHVQFLAGKACLAPLKHTSIPLLELTATVVAVSLVQILERELEEDIPVTYHTDSTTVLHYIANEQQHWPVFVANGVRVIRDFSHTILLMWHLGD